MGCDNWTLLVELVTSQHIPVVFFVSFGQQTFCVTHMETRASQVEGGFVVAIAHNLAMLPVTILAHSLLRRLFRISVGICFSQVSRLAWSVVLYNKEQQTSSHCNVAAASSAVWFSRAACAKLALLKQLRITGLSPPEIRVLLSTGIPATWHQEGAISV